MYRGQIGRPLTFRAPTPVLLFQGFRAQSPQDRLAPARSNVAIDTHTGRCVDTGKRERATQTVDRSIDRQETQTFWSYCIRHLLWTSIYTHETHTQTHTYVCIHECTYAWMYFCIYKCTHMCMHGYMCVCSRVSLSLCNLSFQLGHSFGEVRHLCRSNIRETYAHETLYTYTHCSVSIDL